MARSDREKTKGHAAPEEERADFATRAKQFFLDNYKDIFKILLIVAIVIFVIADYDNLTNLNVRDLLASRHSTWGTYLMVIAIYFVKGIVMVIPMMLVYIPIGMSFATGKAILLNMVGMLAEFLASYYLGRFLSADYIDKLMDQYKLRERLENRGSKRKSWAAMFTIRALPIFPVDIVSLIYGGLRYPLWSYLFWSTLGILPRVLLFTILGNKVYDWFPEITAKMIIYVVLAVLVLSLFGGLITHFRNKRKAKKRTAELTPDAPFAVYTDDNGFRVVKTCIPSQEAEQSWINRQREKVGKMGG